MANRSPERLGNYIRRIRTEKNLSCEDVSKRSARFGKRISGSYINRIENSPTIRPAAERLKALANGLGVPMEELLARAVGVLPLSRSSDELCLLARFRELRPERKTDVLMIVDLWYAEEFSTLSIDHGLGAACQRDRTDRKPK